MLTKKLKACSKVYANPGFGYNAFEQLGPGVCGAAAQTNPTGKRQQVD